MKVLIAVDDSQFSKDMLDDLTSRQWWGDTEFMVLNVMALPDENSWEDWGLTVSLDIIESMQADAEQLVKESVERLRKKLPAEMPVHGKIARGHTVDAIVQAAQEWQADMIMLSTHNRRGLQRFVFGSVAESLLPKAPCSVEIVRHRDSIRKRPRRHSRSA
ncbi:MAG TPA: universal stress protein [Chroococcales cyanobacterium]